MEINKNIYLGSFSWEEVKSFYAKDPVIVLPVGAFEQHGPHLPLDTDTHIGYEIVVKALKTTNYPSAILPSVWAGFSEYHMDFPGTITLQPSTIEMLVYDIIKSLYRHGVKKVILLNSHGGNVSILKSCVDKVGSELGVEAVVVTYWNLITDFVAAKRKSQHGGISHGCELETSLKMHLKPGDVRKDKIKTNVIQGNSYFSPEMFSANKVAVYKPFSQLTNYGHIGDPTVASPQFGQDVLEAVGKELAKIITLLGEGNLC